MAFRHTDKYFEVFVLILFCTVSSQEVSDEWNRFADKFTASQLKVKCIAKVMNTLGINL